jgi:hypothetical protein
MMIAAAPSSAVNNFSRKFQLPCSSHAKRMIPNIFKISDILCG